MRNANAKSHNALITPEEIAEIERKEQVKKVRNDFRNYYSSFNKRISKIDPSVSMFQTLEKQAKVNPQMLLPSTSERKQVKYKPIDYNLAIYGKPTALGDED